MAKTLQPFQSSSFFYPIRFARSSSTVPIPLIPKWAFGFWMSRCSYQTRQEIEEVVLRCEKEQVPIRVIHIDGWQKDGIRRSMGMG